MSVKKNICIIVSTLGLGGAEKVAALQSDMLTELGHTVYVLSISSFDGEGYQFSGEIINLEEIKINRLAIFNPFYRLSFLRKFLREKRIDLVIDHRSRRQFLREMVLSKLIYSYKTIFMIHNIDMVCESNFVEPFVRSKFVFKQLHKNAVKLVCVSKAIEEKIGELHNFNNVMTLYNSFSGSNINQKGKELSISNYILFFGRLEEESKHLSFLINAYHNSILPAKNIKLVLLGDGPDKVLFKELVSKLKLEEDVVFVERRVNPFIIVKNAKFTVLTSNFEGFPMTIIESLACETPVVAVDCETGPREIVKNEINGLLVEKSLSNYIEALNSMVSNEELLLSCKNNCMKSIEHLSYQKIKKEWGDLVDSI